MSKNAKEFYGKVYDNCTIPAQRKVEGAVNRLDDAFAWLEKAICFETDGIADNNLGALQSRIDMSFKAALKAEKEGLSNAGVKYED